MPFQLNSSKLFLTYPQCPLSKEDVLQFFTDQLRSYQFHYVIAHELHQNGDHHIHCYFELDSPYRTRNAKALDILGTDGVRYHGNYQGARSSKLVLKYCTKKEDYLSDMDIASILARKSSRTVAAEQLVLHKRPLEEVVHEHPCLLFGYQRLKMDLTILKEDLEKEVLVLPPFLPNPWAKVLPSFRRGKKRHYWIYSRRPNLGKTFHFAIPLRDEFGAVIATGDLTYWLVKPSTQALILDDYNTAKLKWDALNQLCDGTYQFRVAYRGVVTVAKYIVIVLSNAPISELYPNMNLFLYERFQEIELV